MICGPERLTPYRICDVDRCPRRGRYRKAGMWVCNAHRHQLDVYGRITSIIGQPGRRNWDDDPYAWILAPPTEHHPWIDPRDARSTAPRANTNTRSA